MKIVLTNHFLYLLRLLCFWILTFFIGRLIFLLVNIDLWRHLDFSGALLSNYHALELDLSMACYLLLLNAIIEFFEKIFSSGPLQIFKRIIITIELILVQSITIIDSILFSEWGGKLDFRAITHLTQPDEVFRTATYFQITLAISLISMVTISLFKLYTSKIELKENLFRDSNLLKKISTSFLFLFLIGPILFLGIRGGIKPIPISQSASYFSKHEIFNCAAVNPSWNLIHSIINNPGFSENNPYSVMDSLEAKKIVNGLYASSNDSTIKVLTNSKPDIVLIILESWSSDIVASCGGDNCTKEFDKLSDDGFLFDNTYASALRSDQGMASIFSGFPAQPRTSITKQPGKTSKLPSLIKSLQEEHYYADFLYGGQLRYANIKSYLMQCGFNSILELEDLNQEIPQGRLGIHDEYIFDMHLMNIKKLKSPFISVIYTLSTHNPYDMPLKKKIKFSEIENDYLNSGYYTDSCLGLYFERARLESWYNNTLFILVADHSHTSQKLHERNSPEYHKIPMLLYGDVIKKEFRGKKFEKISCQTDLPATLLSLLNIRQTQFKWSNDLFKNKIPEFAYFPTMADGFGWKTNEGFFIYDYATKSIYNNNYENDTLQQNLRKGQAYLQELFQEYMNY